MDSVDTFVPYRRPSLFETHASAVTFIGAAVGVDQHGGEHSSSSRPRAHHCLARDRRSPPRAPVVVERRVSSVSPGAVVPTVVDSPEKVEPTEQPQQQHQVGGSNASCLSLGLSDGSNSCWGTLGRSLKTVSTTTTTTTTDSSATSTPLSGNSVRHLPPLRRELARGAQALSIVDEAVQIHQQHRGRSPHISCESRSSSGDGDNEEEGGLLVGTTCNPFSGAAADVRGTATHPVPSIGRDTPSGDNPLQLVSEEEEKQQQQQQAAASPSRSQSGEAPQVRPHSITTVSQGSVLSTLVESAASLQPTMGETYPRPTSVSSTPSHHHHHAQQQHASVYDRVEYEEDEVAPQPATTRDPHEPQVLGMSTTGSVGGEYHPIRGSEDTPVEPPRKCFAFGDVTSGPLKKFRRYPPIGATATAGLAPSQRGRGCDTTAAVDGGEYDRHLDVHDNAVDEEEVAVPLDEEHSGAQEMATRYGKHHDVAGNGRAYKHKRNNGSCGGNDDSSAVPLHRRHTTTSISATAGIPYDPSSLGAGSSASAPDCLEKSPSAPQEDCHARPGLRSENKASCATPPDAKSSATPAVAAAGAEALRAMTSLDATHACRALSFLMRMLCHRHKEAPIPSSDFHSHCVPAVSVTAYLQRIARYSYCSVEALLCAFVLLLRYAFSSGHPVTVYNAHRLLITSVLVGIKFFDDTFFKNAYYGQIGGIAPAEMNKLEVRFLDKLDWETQVSTEQYTLLLTMIRALEMDKELSRERLSAFASAHPEKVAAYHPDDDEGDTEEGGVAGTSAAAPAPTESEPSWKQLCGAYRLHQWETVVEPWLKNFREDMLVKRADDAALRASAWKEEEVRWQQYRQEDEKASAQRRQQLGFASAWRSPLSVKHPHQHHRSAHAVTATIAEAPGIVTSSSSSSWAAAPSYQPSGFLYDGQSSHSHNEGISHLHRASSGRPTQTRYHNFVSFADPVVDAYAGAAAVASATASNSISSISGTSDGGRANLANWRHGRGSSNGIVLDHGDGSGSTSGGLMGDRAVVSPASSRHSGEHKRQQSCAATTASFVGDEESQSHRGSSGAEQMKALGEVRYHTAPRVDGPQHVSSASLLFDITNRAAAPHQGPDGNDEGQAEAGHHRAAPPLQPSSSANETASAGPVKTPSSGTPGSGINVYAQPYYYVSSRLRKQQQQQTATKTAAVPVEINPDGNPRSPSSSFTSPSCPNSVVRFGAVAAKTTTTPSTTTTEGASSTGIEVVMSAMCRIGMGDSQGPPQPVKNTARMHQAAQHSFPMQPLLMRGNGAAGNLVTAAQAPPRRSPQALQLQQQQHQSMHHRAPHTAQHASGKKRCKPDSYKDY